MSDNTGKFVWYEYMGSDIAGAVEFYGKVVGWQIAESGMAGFPYQIASVGGHGVAGLLTTPDDAKAMGAPSCWTAYIWVEDVEAGIAKLEAAGGRKWKGPMDIPNIGRFAIVCDAQGAAFALFRDAGGNPPPPPAPSRSQSHNKDPFLRLGGGVVVEAGVTATSCPPAVMRADCPA